MLTIKCSAALCANQVQNLNWKFLFERREGWIGFNYGRLELAAANKMCVFEDAQGCEH